LKDVRKILLVIILSLLVSYDPGANERSISITDNFTPENIRLTNKLSAGKNFEGLEKTVIRFMKS
jgi:hypothetical protein